MCEICSKSKKRHQDDASNVCLVSLLLTLKICYIFPRVPNVGFEHGSVCLESIPNQSPTIINIRSISKISIIIFLVGNNTEILIFRRVWKEQNLVFFVERHLLAKSYDIKD